MKNKLRYQGKIANQPWEPIVEAQLSQQKAIGKVSQIALQCQDINLFLREVVQIITCTLNLPYCAILKQVTEEETLHLIEGIGWNQEEIGTLTIPLKYSYQLTKSLSTSQTLIIEDFTNHNPFFPHSFLADHGVMSGISVIIPSANKPYGILGVYSRQKREYSPQESNFLEIIAQLIGTNLTQLQLTLNNQQISKIIDLQSDRFFELNLDMCCVIGFDGYFKRINRVFTQTLGHCAAELQSKPFLEFVHPDDQLSTLAELENLTQDKQTHHCENRYGYHDGSYRWLAWTFITDVQEKLIYAIARDITEWKDLEVALRKSEERLGRIISTISDGLLVVNTQGNVRFINEAGVRLFGRSATELMDHPIGLPLGNDQPTEIFIQQSQGKLIIAQMRVANISWQGESAYLVSLRDITENYEAQEALSKSEEKYRQIVETTTEGIWMLDQDNKTSFVNQQMAQMLGYKIEEMVGKNLFDFVDFEDNTKVKKQIQEYCKSMGETHDLKFRCRDGRELWTIVSTNPMFDHQGNYVGLLGMITDISQRKKMEQALYESERRLEGILTSIQDVVWSFDVHFSRLIYINPAAQITLGFSLEELYNHPNLWLELIHNDDQQLVQNHRQILKEIGHTEYKYRIIRNDGKIRWLSSRIRSVYDEKGNIIRIDGIDSDITEQKQAEEQLQYNATHDPLTNLPNRILFMDRLKHAIERQKRHPNFTFTVLFLDLDEFKIINDSLGHSIGDKLLQEIAHRLQDGLRSNDTLARLGGDEFTILLEDIENIKDAIKIAKRIHLDLTKPFIIDQQDIFINTSIGIALSGSGYEKATEILRDADTAMYRAKADGKACYAIFDRKMHERAVSRLQLETDLRIGINKQEFSLYYQPIISLKTGQLTGFEALIRWHHPHKNLISPAEFIPIAEETGLIIPIGEWTLKEACQQMKKWQTQFPNYSHLKVAVNLSSKQLKCTNLLNTIDEILKDTKLDNKSLKLEITETLLMENLQTATEILLQIQERGIEICLDDFGTGYSSLSYLHRFPVNTLKIDRSFVMRMEPNNENAEIVRAIVSLAHILGLDIIAEGVETELQLAQLRWLDCEQGQGYFFAQPLTEEEVEDLLNRSRT